MAFPSTAGPRSNFLLRLNDPIGPSRNVSDLPVAPDYYNLINNDDNDGNNMTDNPVGNVLPDNEGFEYAVIPNNEAIGNDIIMDDDNSLASAIDPLQNEIL